MRNHVLAIKILITILVLATGLLPWISALPAYWPVKLDFSQASDGAVALRAFEGVPFPAGLHEGDRFDARRLSVRDRMGVSALAVAPDSTLRLPILRTAQDGSTRVAPYVLRATQHDQAQASAWAWREWPLLLLGLLLVWRGRECVAWSLAVLVLTMAGTSLLFAFPGAPLVSGLIRLFIEYLLRPLMAFSVPAVMLAMLGDRSPALSRAIRIFYGLLLAAFLMERLLIDLPWLLAGVRWMGRPMWVTLTFTYVCMAAFFVFAPLMYRNVDANARLRARWVLVGITLYIVSVLDVILRRDEVSWLVPYMLSVLALAYATLRHKLVPISFAISRTVVYAIIAALIVGVFAVVEHAVAAFAMGKNAGLALHLGVPLVLGILVHRIHGRVEHVVERLFFRRRFLAEQRLDRLANESAYMEKPGGLVARTLHDVASALQVPRVAIYWRDDAHGGYRRRGQLGDPGWPRHVDADDPTFVSMRAGEAAVPLSSPRSPLGSTGIAFAMSVAGRLQGAFVCGERTSQYAPDERKQMIRVAHDVGAALHALGSQASEDRMARLLGGSLTIDELRREIAAGAG